MFVMTDSAQRRSESLQSYWRNRFRFQRTNVRTFSLPGAAVNPNPDLNPNPTLTLGGANPNLNEPEVGGEGGAGGRGGCGGGGGAPRGGGGEEAIAGRNQHHPS
eukprot:3355662-Pyramimonas_sp.AAC.1